MSFSEKIICILILFVFLLVPAGPNAEVVDVSMVNKTFAPQIINIKVGDTVRWTNQDEATHTAASNAAPTSWNTGDVETDESATIVFNTEGDHPYYCIYHTYMVGFVIVGPASAVTSQKSVPGEFELVQNFPNPFNMETVIPYVIPENGPVHVRLDIYDLQGRIIAKLVRGTRNPGRHTVNWNGRNLNNEIVGSGVYLCKLRAGGTEQTIKLMIIK